MARNGLRRTAAAVLAWTLGVAGLAILPGEPAAGLGNQPDWVAALENADKSGKVATVPWQQSPAGVAQANSKPAEPAKFKFPEPAKWDVPLGKMASATLDARPVRVKPKAAAASTDAVGVEVLDRAAAAQAGVSGFVFKVSGADRKLPVELSVDYSSFANAYGGSYASRLRVVKLPEGTPLPARNDPKSQTITADVADISGATTFAVTSGLSGEEGSFAATPMSISGTWQVAPGSGAFTYGYPFDVPKPAGGSAPSVSLGYSSASVDGMTLATNGQGSPSGLGWSDFANAYIERRYEPCIHTLRTTDLCWMDDNATISLEGVSGPLVPVNSTNTEWRALSDPGWKIQRLTGAVYSHDNDKEYWKVTGPDGTQYYFGHTRAGLNTETRSVLAVQVVGDGPGEPCHTGSGVGACMQGWRWYLDRVVDPDGNLQSYLYEREENWYHSRLGATGGVPLSKYDRGAVLKEILYGGRAESTDPNMYSMKVSFGNQWRCFSATENCPAPVKGNTAGFPDAPVDLLCGGTGECTVYGPSFFTVRRYSHVKTEVKVGTGWRAVTQYNLYHRFDINTDKGVASKLHLDRIEHVALAFPKPENPYGVIFPGITGFGYVFNDNRVDHSSHIPTAMRHNRLNRISNPFGGHTFIDYRLNRPCDTSYRLNRHPNWDLNDKDCFPQSIKDGHHTNSLALFHKYLVAKVTEVPGDGSPNIVTNYTYENAPAWAFDDGAYARDTDETGWSTWKGYGTVLVTKGASKTRVRVFRGLHGDTTLVRNPGGGWIPAPGARQEQVTALTSSASYLDHPGLAGRTLEEVQLSTLNGTPGSVVLSRLHEYERHITYDAPEYPIDPQWVGLKSTTESVFSAPGAAPKKRRSVTTYNHVNDPKPIPPPQPVSTLEEGWLDVAGDERCSITTYADNAAAGMFVYPAVNKTVAGQCSSTTVLSLSETYYDGSAALGAAPTKGNPTRKRTRVDASRWSETKTEYDTLGRPVKVTGPAGEVTTTVFTVTAGAPFTQAPVKSTVTNALGHQEITEFHPEFGAPKKEWDANGNLTEKTYDQFGRLTAVWLPDAPIGFAEPSWKFSYDVPNRAVRSQHLVSDPRVPPGVVFEDTWVIYDGFWRERQTQGYSTVSGKVLVSEKTYDERGLVRDEMVEQAVQATPGKLLAVPSSAWLNRTRHSHDELGREVRNEWFRGSSVARATTTSYGVDTVTVTGPDGRRVQERVDGLGRTIAVQEGDGPAWVSSTYGYDLADRLTSVVDPAGTRITYTYNLASWRTGQQDPNRGTASFEYDLAGRQTSVTDALTNKVVNEYDLLGRQTKRLTGTGALLASWQYDTAQGGKGKLHKETTVTSAGSWVSETLGYDSKARATGSKLTVPAGLPGLSGSYTVTQTYDRADRVKAVNLPAIGGLPAETVTTQYNNLGLPTRMAGAAEYVWGATYDDRGRKTSAGFGPRPSGSTWMAKRWTYNLDQKANGSETLVGSTVVSDHKLVFDLTGNVTEKSTRQNGLAWRECYGYDNRNRLTNSHTVAATTACAGGAPGTGDRSYVHSYQYSVDGKLTQRVENGSATAYTYGGARPHAPTKVGTTSYTWDARGSLTARGAEVFSWDVQGLLASVTNVSGKTEFVYDASGQRLLRKAPNGLNTLYIAGHELTANSTGTLSSAVRTYSFNGQLVATRTSAGVVEYVVSDPAGSVEMAYTSGATTPTMTRAYEPYGQVRSQTGDTATDRGFIGQIEDTSTKLSYLNARYYDTAVGIFISTDPLFDTKKPKTLNPYSYSVNNPTTFTDPNGMYAEYAHGLETENAKLREHNKELRAHIGRLESHIEELQGIIRKQQKAINELVSYARALEAEIRRQASIIRQLQARIAYLQRVVVAQQREISRLRGIIAYQQGIIRHQAFVIGYYKGIVNQLGFRLWGGTPQYAYVMNEIHSFRGIPAGAFGYDNISIRDARIASLMAAGSSGGGAAARGGGSSAPALPHGDAAARIAAGKLITSHSLHPGVHRPIALGLGAAMINDGKNGISNPAWLRHSASIQRAAASRGLCDLDDCFDIDAFQRMERIFDIYHGTYLQMGR